MAGGVVIYTGDVGRVDIDGDTHIFIQWKNTKACFDFNCECGSQFHFDGYFAYAVKCSGCGLIYEMPAIVRLKKVDATDMIVQSLVDDEF